MTSCKAVFAFFVRKTSREKRIIVSWVWKSGRFFGTHPFLELEMFLNVPVSLHREGHADLTKFEARFLKFPHNTHAESKQVHAATSLQQHARSVSAGYLFMSFDFVLWEKNGQIQKCEQRGIPRLKIPNNHSTWLPRTLTKYGQRLPGSEN